MHRKVFVGILALLLTLTFAAGVGMAKKDTLVVGVPQEPDGLGPLFTMASGSTVRGFLDYGGGQLSGTYLDNMWNVQPGLAAKVPTIEDGDWKVNKQEGTMEIHWKIREDMNWADGTPITTDYVIFVYNVAMDLKMLISSRSDLKKVDHIEKINDKEFIVHWNELHPFANQMFMGGETLPAHKLEELWKNNKDQFINGTHWTTDYMGNGAYKIKEWVAGSHIELVKNENFFLTEPKIDRIVLKIIEDTETLKVMIRTGEVDVTIPPTIPVDTAMALEKEVNPDEIHVNYTPATVWEHIDLNRRDFKPFRDKRVRKALVHGIDRQTLVDALFNGKQEVAHTMMAKRHPLYTDEAKEVITKYEYNPEKAKELLKEAGYTMKNGVMTSPEGTELVINLRTTAGNRPREMALQVIQDYWKQIGVKAEIEVMPPNVLFDNNHFYRREWPGGILFAWISSPTSLQALWKSEEIPTEENGWAGQNIAGYSNPVADKMINKMEKTMSEKRRQAYALELLKVWTDDIPSIPLWYRLNVATWKTNIKGIKPTGAMHPDSWNCWEWEIQ